MLCLREQHIKSLYASLADNIAHYSIIKSRIPEIFVSLMSPVIARVDDTFKPGASMLTWLSINTESCKLW